MKTAALIIGIAAVVFFLLGYLQRSRRNILLFNLTSRFLYILQYLLLGAFEGAVLDILGALSAALAQRSDSPAMKRYRLPLFFAVHGVTVLAGLILYKNVLSLFPLFGILLQAGALWLKKERTIRLVSMAGCPFWFTYNFASGAYGSCVGDFLALVSLLYSFIRYDLMHKETRK